jgi:hypothetical protein
MKVFTESGSVYTLYVHPKGSLIAVKDGDPTWAPTPCVGVFPDRIDAVMAAVKIEKQPDGRHAGYNAQGVRCCLLWPTSVIRGMRLINRRGFSTTEICKVQGRPEPWIGSLNSFGRV